MSALRQYLGHALRDAGRVELRQLDPDRPPRSGIFDNAIALEDAVLAIAATSTVFSTLNAPRLMPATNVMNGRPLTDSDIAYIVRLPFDFDSVRGAGTNAADAEVAEALARRDRFVAAMTGFGFPFPLLGMSGNGAHAVYRCRLPATAELRETLATIYSTLKRDYTDELVLFDSTVRNPSRIWRIYSTVNRKSPATPDRPQRMATCRIPARWECITPRVLERFANACARRNVRPERPAASSGRSTIAGAGDYRSLDAVAWFGAHGAYKRRLPGGKHAVVCPWRGEHSDPEAGLAPHATSTVLFEGNGERWPVFHCSHAHCDGRGIADVIALWGDADRYCGREFQRGRR